MSLLAFESIGDELPFAHATLLVCRVGAHHDGPFRPGPLRVALAWWRWAVGDLVDLDRAFAQRIAEAVRASVAAAKDGNSLTLGRNLRPLDREACDATILLCQIGHREFDTRKLATWEHEVTVALSARREHDRVNALAQLVIRKVATNIDARRKLDPFSLQLLRGGDRSSASLT